MSEQNGKHVFAMRPPTTKDPEAWKAYWKAQGQPWRTEPEIDVKRQEELARRRAIVPDIAKGIYPFKEMRLSRADVEWLLATHENGRGPVDWSCESQGCLTERVGLDLRGADLQQVNLCRLPLSRIRGGLAGEEWVNATLDQYQVAAVHLEGANLAWTHLEGSSLSYAHLEGADLRQAHLEGADLYGAQLGGKSISMEDTEWTQKWKENIYTTLPVADLRQAFFDTKTKLAHIGICDDKHVGLRLADVHWGDVSLTSIEWTSIKMLRDEQVARQRRDNNGKMKSRVERLRESQRAVRANRQLAVELQNQGLNEEAARFAYRAQELQRIVLRRQKKFGQYLFSGFLDLLAGYGYHPLRTLFWYVLVICTFAWAYSYVWVYSHLERATKHPLSYVGAVIFSITAFHGRGFFLGGDFGYDSLITVLAALEAVIGLIIEFSFIATFTQRFFAR